MDLKEIVLKELENIEELKEVPVSDLLTFPIDNVNGDVCLPCFTLAKSLRKAPKIIADELKEKIVTNTFSKIDSVNGYLNFYLDRKAVFNAVMKNMVTLDNIGSKNVGEGKTVFIDFCSVNLAKYMHIGHLSTTIIGNVIANIYENLGYKVVRLNYVGDYGTPFGKMITAFKRWGSIDDINKNGVDAIQDLYVKFNQEADNDPSLMDEAREWFLKIEKGDKEACDIYNLFIEKSIDEVKNLCNILGVSFDSWRGESYYNDKMTPIVNELDSMGLLQTSEGAKIVDLEKDNLGICMIQKSDGASLYATRDLAAVQDRFETYNFDLGFYVTSIQQKLHFDRWFKVCEYMGRPYAGNLKHIAYGTYSMPTGKIGSRFGKQALVRDMLDQAISKAHDIVTTRGTKVDDVDSLSKAIGVGCIVFGVLKSEKIKDSVFDMDAALNFEGETSPYMQYTHARCCSILEKAGISDIAWNDTELDSIDNVDTFELVKHLNNFEKVVLDAAKNYEPCLISRYLLNLCSLFNKFYNSYRIIENDVVVTSRLAVVLVTKKVLCKGLKLLGIEPITKM